MVTPLNQRWQGSVRRSAVRARSAAVRAVTQPQPLLGAAVQAGAVCVGEQPHTALVQLERVNVQQEIRSSRICRFSFSS